MHDDGLKMELPAQLAEWLDAARLEMVSGASDYSPPGARPGQTPPRRLPRGPASEVRFMFASDAEDTDRAWRATLIVPSGAGVGTPLALSVVDAMGRPIESGTFRLAGCSIPIAAGRGMILFELFVGGLRDVCVELVRCGCPAEVGTLAFFGPEEM